MENLTDCSAGGARHDTTTGLNGPTTNVVNLEIGPGSRHPRSSAGGISRPEHRLLAAGTSGRANSRPRWPREGYMLEIEAEAAVK